MIYFYFISRVMLNEVKHLANVSCKVPVRDPCFSLTASDLKLWMTETRLFLNREFVYAMAVVLLSGLKDS